jgi:rubrerythrin
MDESSIKARCMTTDEIMRVLADVKDDAEDVIANKDTEPHQARFWEQRIAACEAATAILSALQDEGIDDADGVRDLIEDYNKLAMQYKTMVKKFYTAAKPIKKAEIYLCPDCGHRITMKHTHCHWCGKKLGGW